MSSGRPKGPGSMYTTLTLALLMVLALLALTQRQPPTPTIAEFAPQALEQITDPSTDSSVGKTGAQSGLDDDGNVFEAEPTPQPIDIPRVRKCVGDPPRQIEDPQSPPCVPYWSGDNGGATYKGVTRDEVRVFSPVPQIGPGDPEVSARRLMDALATFFNRRFEFYGRKLVLRTREEPDSDGDLNGRTAQQAFAVQADEQDHAFAGTYYLSSAGLYYHMELARRGLVSAKGNPEFVLNQDVLASHGPYLWQYEMSSERMFAGAGNWICSRLASRPAVHSGDPLMQQRTRLFGVLHANYAGHATKTEWPNVAEATVPMSGCGATPAVVVDQDFDNGDTQGQQNLILRFKTANVTTVLCLCIALTFPYIFGAATSQNYFPEWLATSYGDIDTNYWFKFWQGNTNTSQARNLFGVTYIPRQVAISREPWVEALSEVDAEAATSPGNLDLLHAWMFREYYHSLLLIASGIQMAGPRLTPQTFATGLHKARFPNPQDERNPGRVGFESGSFSMTKDGAEWWWNPSARSPYPGDSAGAFCYADAGRRYPIDGWPTSGDPFFSTSCDSVGSG